MRIERGKQFRGVVEAIEPIIKYGGDGDGLMAIIRRRGYDLPAWLPLENLTTFSIGDIVRVTPVTEFEGKRFYYTF